MRTLINSVTKNLLWAALTLGVVGSLMLASLPACQALTERVDVVDSVVMLDLYRPVAARHDVFVQNDRELRIQLTIDYQEESAHVRDLLEAAGPKISPTTLQPQLSRVLERHDAYVDAQVLDAVDRADYLRSSSLLRDLADQALQGAPPP